MTYFLGIDLGTTYTAAAIYENGRASIIDLSSRTAIIPSVVFLAEDGTYLVGDAATRRALTEPTRAAKQFKRRFGDTTPILLGGSPISADQLSAQLLKAVVADVTERQGAAPQGITITHPANWGGYKLELLEQSIRAAGLTDVKMITEPEAAVLHYAQLERVPAGSLVAVFDLGGGTFDAAIVRKTETGTEFIGRPEGIERLGGIDFDQAVFAFVSGYLDGAIESLDLSVPAARSALERLRVECVDAKEALSSDDFADINVMLPNKQTTVRITRSEFEALIRPSLGQAIDALRRALTSAGIVPNELKSVLLAGGSSRIPLVREMVSGELGRPVAVDSHPKHVVALGAALAAGTASAAAVIVVTPSAATPVPVPASPSTAMPTVAQTVAPTPGPTGGPNGSKLKLMIAGGVVAALAIGGGAFALLGGGSDSAQPVATTPATNEASTTLADSSSTTVASQQTTTTAVASTTLPFPASTLRVALTGLTIVGNHYEVTYDTFNFEPSFDVGKFHLHFFWNTDAPASVGVTSSPQGTWIVWALRDGRDKVFDQFLTTDVPLGATAICAVVATAEHSVHSPQYVDDTVSCLDL